jgi:putative ABC transport system permease protein
VDEEVDAELEFHVEMRTRELVERGMSREAARDAAIARFVNIARVGETCRALGRQRDKDMRRTEYFSELAQDVRFACRQLLRNPGFSAIAVITLALGIGATAAIFSAVHSVVLRPLPFPNSNRITSIYEVYQNGNGNVSAGNFVDGVEPVRAFDAVTAVQYSNFNLSASGDAERVVGARVTAGFFDVFRMPPARGRVFTREEDQPGREQLVVLSHRLWTRRFGADPSIVGRQIVLNDRPYEIIGVMPRAFDFTADSEELWVPIAFTPERKATHDEHYLQIYASLAPGATLAQALAELASNVEPIRRNFPRDASNLSFTAVPMVQDITLNYSRRLYTLLGAVGFVLLIACGNVANLLLARGAARSTELAVRSALGAGRARITRQLLTESVVLAIVAATLGLALAGFGIRALVAAAPPGVPRLEQTTLDMTVLGFTLLVSLTSAVLFGLAPAWRAARVDVQTVIKQGGRGAGSGGVRDRLRTGLIVAELAVAILLLVGAGLLIRSSIAMQRVDPGFDPQGVLSARISLPAATYAERTTVVQTFERLAEAAAQIPGATAAGISTQVPMSPGGNGNGLLPEGKTRALENLISSRLRMITPGYLDTMRIPLLKGRHFTTADRRESLRVMIVSQALANAAFPGQDPIGKRIGCCESGPDGATPDYKTIVGVAGDVRSRGLGEAPSPEFYLPIDQVPPEAWAWVQRTAYIAVRTTVDPNAMANPIRTVARATAKFNTLLLALLGVVGLVLSSVGIYGVIAYFVTRRTQEIGVRMALGASRRDVVGLVFRQAALPIGLGIGAGVIAAALLARVLRAQVVGISIYDPLTFTGVVAVMAVVAAVASLIPASRAAALDPTKALNQS